MQHRDIITSKKIVSEADFVIETISNIEQSEFIEDEILKRAAAIRRSRYDRTNKRS